MKTTKEWFETLDEEYRDRALKNMTSPNAKHFSLLGAISNGFNWENSLEGSNYWQKVFREIKTGVKYEDDSSVDLFENVPVIQSKIEPKKNLISEYKSQVSQQIKIEEPKVTEVNVETIETNVNDQTDKETPPPLPPNYVPRIDKNPLMDAYKKQQEFGIQIDAEYIPEKN